MRIVKSAGKLGSLLLCLLAVVLVSSGPALAQPQDAGQPYDQSVGQPSDNQNQPDPPSRVARISYIDGSVSMQPGGDGDWGAAAKNRPITIGDKLWVDKDSRAELEAGQATLHLGSMTALSFLNLDDAITQMRLAEGALNFRVRELREGDVYEVDTPNLAFTVKQAGAFRIDVSEDGNGTRITVIRGEGEVTASGKTYAIHAGERGEFTGSDSDVQHSVGRAPGPDGLDRWSNERDLKQDNSASARYVSRDTPGYSDLDDHGTWSEVPEYGHVWYPTVVDAGWAPYSTGYWGWVAPWGWTWIDYAPWGFAPYHYGRWAFIGGRWGWCPGPIYARPFYGPAFVGFFGGAGWGVGFGFGFGGGVGWFPLGWGEPYHPWFHCGHGFVHNINVHNTMIRNTAIINNNHFNYRYANNTRAVTVASRNTFVNGQRINRGQFHVTEASLRGAQVTHNPGLSPTRQSHFGAANTGARISTPSSAIQNRQVMARTAPASAASHLPVRTMNTRSQTPGRVSNSPANGGINRSSNGGAGRPSGSTNPQGQDARDRQLAMNRPPSARSENARGNNGGFAGTTSERVSRGPTPSGSSNGSNRPSTRTWDAQGNSTDRGRAPQGFGRDNSPAQSGRPNGQVSRNDRPAWAGSAANSGQRSAPSYNSNRAPSNGGNRSYGPQGGNSGSNSPRSYSPPSRSYSSPSPRSYSPPRTYSAPSRSYPSSPRSYSPPSRGSGGGGGGSRGGGSSHSSGSSPHSGSSSHSRH
jgi:uncharacterized protein DUF6600